MTYPASDEEVEALRRERGPLWSAVFDTLRNYRVTNMGDVDTGEPSFPLVDLMSNDGCSIATGEQEMILLADEIVSAARLSASQAGAASGAVGVKALEWVKTALLSRFEERIAVRMADSILGTYAVEQEGKTDPIFLVTLAGLTVNDRQGYGSIEAAVSAAQADYEQRILSALTAAPSPSPSSAGDENDRLREAVEAEREACANVADNFKLGEFRNGQAVFADDVAAAIRARSTLGGSSNE